MIKVSPIKQSTSYSCGPASLKMVLDYVGVETSEEDLITLTGAREGYGCDPDDLVKASKTLGCKAVYKQNSFVKEVEKYLKDNVPVIVNWFSPTALGHYSVVVGMDKTTIVLADPEFGELKKLKLSEFVNRWFELDEYPPKDQSRFALREIVVVQE